MMALHWPRRRLSAGAARSPCASGRRGPGIASPVPIAGTGVSVIADDRIRYARLEAGARYLAARTGCFAERDEHLGMAELYARRRAQAITWGND
ncbi:MAG TPA: hypothetical protein VGB79_03335 [Allosphingosinicella sp.]|jgi:hypothetical protein